MKEMYVIEKEQHKIPEIKIKLRNVDLYDAETDEWIAHVAGQACEAKVVFRYRDENGKQRFIVEMDEFDEIAVYSVSASDIAKAFGARRCILQ